MTQGFNPGEEPQDEDELEEEEEEEHGGPAQEEIAQQVTPNPVPVSAVGVGKPSELRQDGRPRKKGPRKKTTEGTGKRPIEHIDPGTPQEPKEADLKWAWIVDTVLPKYNMEPGHVTIRVGRIDVGQEVTIGNLRGDAVQGDDYQSPADALLNAITELHLNSGVRTSCVYNVAFTYQNAIRHRGQIRLQSPQEINNQRHSQWYPGMGASPQYGQQYVPQPPQQQRRRGMGAPPQYGPGMGNGYPPPGYPQAPQYPPQYPQQPYDPRADRMEREMQELKGLLKQVITSSGQPAAPTHTPLTFEALRDLREVLEPLGIRISAAPGLGAPAVAAPAPVPATESQQFEEEIVRSLRTGLGKKLQSMLGELLDPSSKKVEEEEEEEEGPKADTDFDTVEVPVPWPGTQEPVRYARDKETGNIDWVKSLVFCNPHFVEKYGEKMFDVAGKFADAVKRTGVAGPPQQLPPPVREHMNGPVAQPSAPPTQPAPAPQHDDDDGFGL